MARSPSGIASEPKSPASAINYKPLKPSGPALCHSAANSRKSRPSSSKLGDARYNDWQDILCRPRVKNHYMGRPTAPFVARVHFNLCSVDVPQYKRDFRRKLVYFRSQPPLRPLPGQTHITISRTSIFHDAYSEFMRLPPNELKKRLMIKFSGEEGLDYGGLSREFFFLLSHEISNPLYGLLEYASNNNYTLQINSHSDVNPEHLDYFRFIGRMCGLAVFHQRFLDAFFVVSVYKSILNLKCTLGDMESIDATLHRSLQWMLY